MHKPAFLFLLLYCPIKRQNCPCLSYHLLSFVSLSHVLWCDEAFPVRQGVPAVAIYPPLFCFSLQLSIIMLVQKVKNVP